MKSKVEQALRTVKDDHETWQQVFDRVAVERGWDMKTVTKVLAAIVTYLEESEVQYKPRREIGMELPVELPKFPRDDLICSTCGFLAKSKAGLSSHMRSHTS